MTWWVQGPVVAPFVHVKVCPASRFRGSRGTFLGHRCGMAATRRGAVIIDLDNTLVRGSALFHFGAFLVRRRRIAARHVLRFAVAEAAYAWAHVEPADLPSEVARRGLGLVRGRRQAEVASWAREFSTNQLSRYLIADLALAIDDFRRAGYATFIATASPQELADAVAETLRLDGAIGTRSAVVNGVYTGALEGAIAHGEFKARRVRTLLEERGFDPREAFALSDSVTDLPLLSMVGNPVAVNPDRELNRIASANDWRILRSRETSAASLAHLRVLFPHPY